MENEISSSTCTAGVIGLGYVGLPLVKALVDAGFKTFGFDIDQRKIRTLHSGRSYIAHLSDEWIHASVDSGRLIPTSDLNRLREPDVLLICVPTPLTATLEPDLSHVTSTAEAVAKTLRAGQLVVLESTTYPGTTRDVVLPILERSGLCLGRDFFLAFSPEREDPGNKQHNMSTVPKVIGAADETSLRLACQLYGAFVASVVPVSSFEVAEACKILENTYRAVNIAMVNEFKKLLMRMGIDVWETIDAAKSKPFGFQAFYPGPGLGGHCIPIDPFYLSWVARKFNMSMRFIELAGEVNRSMPEFVIEQVTGALNSRGRSVKGSKICLLGVAYKADIDDPRESPFFELFALLRDRGAVLNYSDPHVPTLPQMRHYDVPVLESVPLTADFIASQDCILIVTNHSGFDYRFIVEHSTLVVDTRNATKGLTQGREKIIKA